MPRFKEVDLSEADLDFTNKIMSSDALAAQVLTRIKRKIPTSVIRMADGERAFIAYSQGAAPAGFMQSPEWLNRYGLAGADLAKVGRDLLQAGEEADFLACTISGLAWPDYRVHQYFPTRGQFIDQFYPYFWDTKERTGHILRAAPVLLLHRDHALYVPRIAKRYGVQDIEGMPLASWRDHDRIIEALKQHRAGTVLVCGGPSGKAFCVRLAKATGKVVLDVGEAITLAWGKA